MKRANIQTDLYTQEELRDPDREIARGYIVMNKEKCRFVKHMSHLCINKCFEIPFFQTSATMLYIPHIFH